MRFQTINISYFFEFYDNTGEKINCGCTLISMTARPTTQTCLGCGRAQTHADALESGSPRDDVQVAKEAYTMRSNTLKALKEGGIVPCAPKQ